jgi:hypothetical protein
VKAAGLLVKFGERCSPGDRDPEPAKGSRSSTWAYCRCQTNDLLSPLVTDEQQPLAIRGCGCRISRNAPRAK